MLIVEDGTGIANADSLGSLEEAASYHASRGNVLWATFTPAKQEALMRKAADYIKYIFGPSFIGVKAFVGQGQPFPRYYNYNIIVTPVEIKEAQFELALAANSGPLMPNQTTIRKKSVKVGPITVEYDASGFIGPRFIAATSRLAQFMDSKTSGITARVVRT